MGHYRKELTLKVKSHSAIYKTCIVECSERDRETETSLKFTDELNLLHVKINYVFKHSYVATQLQR